MEVKHTPTPWSYEPLAGAVVAPIIGEENQWVLVADCTESGDDETVDANGILIARAVNALPDLVTALKEAMHYVGRYEAEHESNVALDVFSKCEAALAKATSPD